MARGFGPDPIVSAPHGRTLLTFDKARLNTVRGLAILLVVVFHVIGPGPGDGMRLPAESPLHPFAAGLAFLRLPVLATVSGYLYARRRLANRHMLGPFFRTKTVRLIVPAVLALVVFQQIHAAMGETVPLPRALFFAYEHFWYIQSLLVIFFVIALCDAVWQPDWISLLLGAFGLSTLCALSAYHPFLSLGGALTLAPLFLIGMVFRDRAAVLSSPAFDRLAGGAVLIYLLGYIANQLIFHMPGQPATLGYCMGGGATAFLLFRYTPAIRGLNLLGEYSLSVYLWHPAAAGLARTVVYRFAPESGMLLLFAAMLTTGLLVPISMAKIAGAISMPARLSGGRAWKPSRSWPRPRMSIFAPPSPAEDPHQESRAA
ncbi:acyltransferase [Sphingomonas sp. BIUV-7]|uniref:Acyltransferase n=1 Tax=Sphingomonas natans TaxID=3063330 RepID=A0ABT8Y617_9SPHN|nr:acyltransferase [Sphingomonas sp. BIUV-7]MDO6413765.1 acyltransferase [Sphingomonas sp. BIUV-7]